jgi:hypothetical protein
MLPLLRRAQAESGWTSEGPAPDPSLLDPAPPVAPVGPRLLRLAARLALWSLVGVGALRGLVPAPAPSAAPTTTVDDRAVAVAGAFLREYLTAGDGRAGWHTRVRPFMAAGADVGDEPRLASGRSRYADQVLPSGARAAGAGLDVTVLAHVVEVKDGQYRDDRMVAYVVAVRATSDGVTVSGPPRPHALPFAPARTSS